MIGDLTTTQNANSVLHTLNNLHINCNPTDPKEQFQTFILSYCEELPKAFIADGQIHRYGKNNRYAYKYHDDDRPAGFFQDFKNDIKVNWKSEGQRKEYSISDRQAYKIRGIEKEQQRHKKDLSLQASAANKAVYIWSHAVSGDHPYLLKKTIKEHNSRVYRSALIVPIYDRTKALVNLQFISPDGEKRFLKDGKKKGCFSVIGQSNDGPIGITEGFGTGASVFEKFGFQTVVALDAGNLELVARTWKEMFPKRHICIYGDSDLSGVGQAAAKAAAEAVGGTFTIPPIVGQDWNDVFSADKGASI